MKTKLRHKLRTFTLLVFMFTGLIHLWAGDTLTLNIANGSVYIESTGYRIGSTTATLNSFAGSYIIMGSSKTASVVIKSGSQDIIFENLNIDRGTSSYGAGISSAGDIHIRLVGKNYLNGTRGLTINGTSGTQRVFITGDTLYATSTSYYPGIGSFQNNIQKIEIDGAYISAQCPNGTSAGLGYSYYPATLDSLVINEGILSASSAGYYGYGANKIIINEGSVKGSTSTTAINSSGTKVYCVTVPHHGSLSIPVTSGTGETQTYTFPCFHENDDNFYIYLPDGSYKFSTGGMQYAATVKGEAVTAMLDSIDGDGNIVLTGDLVTVKDSSYTIGSQPYKYTGHLYTFSGSSSVYGVVFSGGTNDTVVLNNLNIKATEGAAFELNGGKSLPVVLKGYNQLVSTSGPGLQKTSISGLLTISGDTLIASGGLLSAGIGGASKSEADSITITGGVIVATGGKWGAGIGGGYEAIGKHITISGGKVTTASTADINGYTGSGIGGGYPAGASDILISGGFVKATSMGNNHAIGGSPGKSVTNVKITGGMVEAYSNASYTLPEGIQISGGTVFAQMTGTPDQNYNFAFNGGIITGGSVNPVGSDGVSASVTKYNSFDAHPTNVLSSDKLYRSMYKVPGVTDTAKIDSIKINGTPWNCNDLYTDIHGVVYLWLPVTLANNVQVYVRGKAYTYTGNTVAYDNYVPADEANDVPEYGNYLWQLPISITTPEHGSLSVTSNSLAVKDGDYRCYKTSMPLSITAIPETGYELNAITVNGKTTKGDTTVVVSDTVKISATFSLQTLVVSFYDFNKSLLYKDTVTYGSTAVYGGYTPVRQATPEYSFKFKGWSSALSNVQSDLTVYAVYDSTANAVVGEKKATLYSMKDNTIVETIDGSAANSTALIYVGNVAKTDNIRRRGLVAFGTSVLPKDVVIDSVKLKLSVSSASTMGIELYRVKTNWTEGASYASGGMGVTATPYDVTWLHASYSGTSWSTPGGDVDAAPITSSALLASDTLLTFSGNELKEQVKAWVADSDSNCGFLLASSNETTSAKGVISKFYSKETAPTLAKKPTLEVYYHALTDALASPSAASDLAIYPVPAIDWVTISTTASIRSVKVLDLSGKTLQIGTGSTMDVRSLSKGMYLMQVSTDKGIVTRQLIKK